GAFADDEHAAVVTMPAVLDDGDVEVDDVALFQRPLVGDAVADAVIDRGANRLRVRRAATGRVVQRGGDGALHIDHVVVGEAVQLFGGDARFDERGEVVEDFAGQTARQPHAVQVATGLDGDAHRGEIIRLSA